MHGKIRIFAKFVPISEYYTLDFGGPMISLREISYKINEIFTKYM